MASGKRKSGRRVGGWGGERYRRLAMGGWLAVWPLAMAEHGCPEIRNVFLHAGPLSMVGKVALMVPWPNSRMDTLCLLLERLVGGRVVHSGVRHLAVAALGRGCD